MSKWKVKHIHPLKRGEDVVGAKVVLCTDVPEMIEVTHEDRYNFEKAPSDQEFYTIEEVDVPVRTPEGKPFLDSKGKPTFGKAPVRILSDGAHFVAHPLDIPPQLQKNPEYAEVPLEFTWEKDEHETLEEFRAHVMAESERIRNHYETVTSVEEGEEDWVG